MLCEAGLEAAEETNWAWERRALGVEGSLWGSPLMGPGHSGVQAFQCGNEHWLGLRVWSPVLLPCRV